MLLEVQNLDAGYGAVPVLRGVSMQVAPGEVIAVLGSNGAGKTTLNRVLSGLMPPWAGSVRFEDTDVTGRDASLMVEAGLVHVPEGRRVFPNLSVRENLELGSYRRARANRARNFDLVVSIFPRLKERLAQAAGTLSGGEQQMLPISRAIMSKPKLMMFDEPSLGLAPNIVEQVFDIIDNIRKAGTTVLMVEQNAYSALEMCDYAYLIEAGTIVLSGTGEELIDNKHIRAAYLGGSTH